MWWMMAMWAMGMAEAKPCPLGSGNDQLFYDSAAKLVTEETERAKVELRAPNPTPPNGQVVVIVERSTIDAGMGGNHVVAIEAGGQVVVRFEETPGSVPVAPTNGYGWRNIFKVPIPDGTVLPITVRAVDKAAQAACLWDIGADGKVGKPRKE